MMVVIANGQGTREKPPVAAVATAQRESVLPRRADFEALSDALYNARDDALSASPPSISRRSIAMTAMTLPSLGIESDEVGNYVLSKTWPANREQRAWIIGEWLRAEARFLIAPSIVPE
jgi:hypothetical protein